MFLTHDTVDGITFRYALVVVDVASRYVDAEVLSNKNAESVARAFERIYSRRLEYPKTLIVDEGKEFKGAVSRLMKENDVRIRRGEPGNHRAQAFVERANRKIAERLYTHQYAQEYLLPDSERSRVWVMRLRKVISAINREPRRILTGETPTEAIDLDKVKLSDVKYRRPAGADEISTFSW